MSLDARMTFQMALNIVGASPALNDPIIVEPLRGLLDRQAADVIRDGYSAGVDCSSLASTSFSSWRAWSVC